MKKGQLNPPGNVQAKPVSPKVSRDVPEAWVNSYKATQRNPIAEFNALFVEGEKQ